MLSMKNPIIEQLKKQRQSQKNLTKYFNQDQNDHRLNLISAQASRTNLLSSGQPIQKQPITIIPLSNKHIKYKNGTNNKQKCPKTKTNNKSKQIADNIHGSRTSCLSSLSKISKRQQTQKKSPSRTNKHYQTQRLIQNQNNRSRFQSAINKPIQSVPFVYDKLNKNISNQVNNQQISTRFYSNTQNLDQIKYITQLERQNHNNKQIIQKLRTNIKQKDLLLDECQKQIYHLKKVYSDLYQTTNKKDQSQLHNNVETRDIINCKNVITEQQSRIQDSSILNLNNNKDQDIQIQESSFQITNSINENEIQPNKPNLNSFNCQKTLQYNQSFCENNKMMLKARTKIQQTRNDINLLRERVNSVMKKHQNVRNGSVLGKNKQNKENLQQIPVQNSKIYHGVIKSNNIVIKSNNIDRVKCFQSLVMPVHRLVAQNHKHYN